MRSKVEKISETPYWMIELKEFLTLRNIIGLVWFLVDLVVIVLLIIGGA